MANGQFAQAGNILQGVAAGLGGQGQQFLQRQQLEGERQTDRERALRKEETAIQKQQTLERQKTVFQDSFTALQFAEAGQWDQVAKVGENRLRDSAQFPGGDFSETEQLTKIAEVAATGDKGAQDKLLTQLRTNVKLGEQVGVLKGPEQFTLSPGQKRFAGEREIAAAPETEGAKEARELRRQEAELRQQDIQLRTETNRIKRGELEASIQRGKAERQFQAESSLANFDDSLATIDQLLEGEGLESAAGVSASFPTFAGTAAADFEATLETLQSQNFLNAVEKMKGLGALSENEGRKLSAAIGALDLSQKDTTLRKQINTIREKIVQARGRAEKKFNISVPAITRGRGQGTETVPGAPKTVRVNF